MIVVAYDGSNYSGWQIQPNGVTIEQKLNEALTDLLQEPISIMGASRTDAGVHSLGNVAVFDTNSRMPADKISFALNQRLPDDIVVQYSCQVEDDFHPRYAACRKTYEYKILNRKMPDPTKRKDTFHYYYDLDVDKMNEAAAYLIGQHDFTSFSSVKAQVKSAFSDGRNR
jgi:tRNA pseudouridine38-40 synthase